MKKRLLSLLLAFALVVGLVPVAQADDVTSAINTGYNSATARPSDSVLFSTAYVQNKGAGSGSNGTARQLEVVVNLRDFGSENHFYAVVMPAGEYGSALVGGPGKAELTKATYFKLSGVSTAAKYAMGRQICASGTDGQTLILPLVEPSSANNETLENGGTVSHKQMALPAVSGSNYFDEYVLVVFAEKVGVSGTSDPDSHYYIDRFYLDAQGYVRTPSYYLRYNANNPAGTGTVAGMPANTIIRTTWEDRDKVPGDTTLSTAAPTRTGYTFLGWTDKQMDFLAEDADLDAALTAAGAVCYQPGDPYAQPAELDKVYDLYALWRVVPVKFQQTGTKVTLSKDSDTKTVSVLQLPTPQVGVSYVMGAVKLDSQSDANSTKEYRWESDWQGTYSSEAVTTVDPKSAYAIEPDADTADAKMSWRFTGTPSDHSDGAPVFVLLEVRDVSNDTTDYLLVRFTEVQRGAQATPTLDDNTGIDTRIETKTVTSGEGEGAETATVQDGQIFGFYSKGPTVQTDSDPTGYFLSDSAGTKGMDGTGTMTNYYLSSYKVFEYRPVEIGGEAIGYDSSKGEDGVETNPYAAMPNSGWRELPFPKGWYTDAQLTDLAPTMQKNATALALSAWNCDNALTVSTPENANAWLDSYGYIEFDADSGLPVVHGLNEGDKYEIRFRANANYAASDSKTVTIGGAVGGAGGSGSADPSQCAAIVFYDWDETTILGTLVVTKGSDATKLVEDFASTLKSPASKDVDSTKENYFVDDADYPLTYKKGYSFEGCWLPFESETLTHYGSEVQGKLVAKPTDEAVDFSKVTGDLVVKACYGANSELSTNPYMYTTEILSEETTRVTGNNFILKVKINRENTDSSGNTVGVPRLGKPAVRVLMTTTAGVNLYSLVNLDNTDETIIEVVPSTSIQNVQVNVVDTYQLSNWVAAGIMSMNTTDSLGGVTSSLISGGAWNPSGTFTGNGYLYQGTLAMINETLEASNSGAITAVLLNEIHLDYSMCPGNATKRLREARTNLQTAFDTLNKDLPECAAKQGLSYKQMQYAIANSGALLQ